MVKLPKVNRIKERFGYINIKNYELIKLKT